MNANIRSFFLTVLAVLCLLGLPGRACSLEEPPVRILLQWMPQAQFAGYIMALEKGFFAEEGLPHVELMWTRLGEMPLHRLARGEVDFVSAWLIAGLQRRAEGLPIVNIAQFMQEAGTLVVARKDKGIRTMADLNGKTILTWGGDFSFEFELFLKLNNIKPAQVYPLSVSLAPFLHGLADAMQAMEYSEYLRLLERGMKPEEIVVFALKDYKVRLPGDGLYTSVSYFEAHRDKAKAVRRAVIRGWEYAFAHEEETVAIVLREATAWNFGSNASYQRDMLRIIHKLMQSPGVRMGDLSREAFDTSLVLALEAGLPLSDETYESFHRTP